MDDIMPSAERRFYWQLFDEIVKTAEDWDSSEASLIEGLARAGRTMADRDLPSDAGFPKRSVLPAVNASTAEKSSSESRKGSG